MNVIVKVLHGSYSILYNCISLGIQFHTYGECKAKIEGIIAGFSHKGDI